MSWSNFDAMMAAVRAQEPHTLAVAAAADPDVLEAVREAVRLGLARALSPEAGRHKGLGGPVAGQADLLLVPDIEAGNLLAKSMVYTGGATFAGLVLGAAVPTVLTSRADTPRSKLVSIAMALLSAQ